MAINYSWHLSKLETKPNGEDKYLAHWHCHATDGVYTLTAAGFVPLPFSYEGMTNEEVLQWCLNNDIDTAQYEATLQQQINALVSSGATPPEQPVVIEESTEF